MAISANITAAYTFLKNHQPLMFMHVILMDVLSGKFPGRNLMPLFELIVVSIEKRNSRKFVFTNVLSKFDECRSLSVVRAQLTT